MRVVMSQSEIEVALEQLDEWILFQESGIFKLSRSFVFHNFSEAWAFMSRVALLSEQLNHHPNWSNVYKRVDIVLYSHDVQGVSVLDVQMAAKINALSS